MKRFIIFLQLEIKREIKSLKSLLLGAVALSLLITAIALSGEKLMYSSDSVSDITIAIVTKSDSTMMNFAIGFLENLNSGSGSFRFLRTEESEAKELLASGNAIAVMTVPETLIEDIQKGVGTEIQITFPSNSGFEAAVIKEITEAGATLMSSAQSGIYSLYDFYAAHDAGNLIDSAADKMNTLYITKSIGRLGFFNDVTTSVTKSLSLLDYYMLSGIILFLLLWGTCCSDFVKDENTALKQKLSSYGISPSLRIIVKIVSLSVIMILTGAFLGSVGALLLYLFDLNLFHISGMAVLGFIGTLLLIMLTSASIIMFIYTIAPNKMSGIMLLFISTVAMVFISGGFLPSAFLPSVINRIAEFIPTTYMLQTLSNAYLGAIRFNNILSLIEIIILFYVASAVTEQFKQTKNIM